MTHEEIIAALRPFAEAAQDLPSETENGVGSFKDFNLWESASAMNLMASDLVRAESVLSALAKLQAQETP